MNKELQKAASVKVSPLDKFRKALDNMDKTLKSIKKDLEHEEKKRNK